MPVIDVVCVHSLSRVHAAEFDTLVGQDNPFIEHNFLNALEQSQSVGAVAGWVPSHVFARRNNLLVGAIPAYVKDNSFGEYIFDWAWAQAAHRARIPYYPKVVCAVPFTPASGPRILLHPDDPDKDSVTESLINGLFSLAESSRASSIHVLFCTEAERNTLVSRYGFLPRITFQYHWYADHYLSFEDYLSRLRAPARKMIRRERRQVQDAGVEVDVVPGRDLADNQWDLLYRYYRSTAREYGANPYLTREFFSVIRESQNQRALGIFARQNAKTIAGSLYFEKGRHLYGRYWGCSEDIPALHFELCYYRPIEYAITRGHTLFEAGAQGEHKIKRGLMPRATYSAHWFRDQRFAASVSGYLDREAQVVAEQMMALSACGPFHRNS